MWGFCAPPERKTVSIGAFSCRHARETISLGVPKFDTTNAIDTASCILIRKAKLRVKIDPVAFGAILKKWCHGVISAPTQVATRKCSPITLHSETSCNLKFFCNHIPLGRRLQLANAL
ncbi:MAG: hypothetical protein ACRC2T_06765 [Thermoguttaceae bacterium]